MFNHQLTANGRKIAQARYQFLLELGCKPGHARNAAEALTLEQENPDFIRSPYDERDICECWQKITARDE